ncbi:uncharacterized protein MYCFIDRAFT_176935 [Pseudocercospora fijiensis CIRAD86]|uniref:Uncharacterized protein n=1 Tax=Pseudocercospora fijiensis (strain CIRAD86) TaxID=383855 RepID=M3A5N6_PSEFD|nr:uncharacterized protein MYCFIDRAFT_176935 [Pseudocercospora fijiensis CIRAD86]EME79936.1 hypothetical protein MYCFIDRAFT_176935 [Pseudocercospora fijiensis CIRAD86]
MVVTPMLGTANEDGEEELPEGNPDWNFDGKGRVLWRTRCMQKLWVQCDLHSTNLLTDAIGYEKQVYGLTKIFAQRTLHRVRYDLESSSDTDVFGTVLAKDNGAVGALSRYDPESSSYTDNEKLLGLFREKDKGVQSGKQTSPSRSNTRVWSYATEVSLTTVCKPKFPIMVDQNAKQNKSSAPAKRARSTPKKSETTKTQGNSSTPAQTGSSTPEKVSATPTQAGPSTPKKTSTTPTQNKTSTPAQAGSLTPKNVSTTPNQNKTSTPAPSQAEPSTSKKASTTPTQAGPSTQNQGPTAQATTKNTPTTIQVVLDAHTEPYQGTKPIPPDLQNFSNKVNADLLSDPEFARKLDPNPPRSRTWLLQHDDLRIFLANNCYLRGNSTIFEFWMDDRLFTKWVWRNLATSDERPGMRIGEFSSREKGRVSVPAVARPGDPQRPTTWAEGRIMADFGTPVVRLPGLVPAVGLGGGGGGSVAAVAGSGGSKVAKKSDDERKDKGEEEEEEEKVGKDEVDEEEVKNDGKDDTTTEADRGSSDSESEMPAPKKFKNMSEYSKFLAPMTRVERNDFEMRQVSAASEERLKPEMDHIKEMIKEADRMEEERKEREEKEKADAEKEKEEREREEKEREEKEKEEREREEREREEKDAGKENGKKGIKEENPCSKFTLHFGKFSTYSCEEACFPVLDGTLNDPKELSAWWEPNIGRLCVKDRRFVPSFFGCLAACETHNTTDLNGYMSNKPRMAADEDFQFNAKHRNTKSEADSFCGTFNEVPLNSNAGSRTTGHSTDGQSDKSRDDCTDTPVPPTSNHERNDHIEECRSPGQEDECSTEAPDKFAIAVTGCSKTIPTHCANSDSSRYRPRPVKDTAIFKAFPPAARQRELKQEATKFAANARNIFVHHVDPVLELRRKEKLASGTTKKKFYSNAARLWAEMQTIDDLHEQRFFWNQKSVEMKLALKKKTVTPGNLLQDAGFEEDWWECRKYAEMAVGWYLGQDVPEEFGDDITGNDMDSEDHNQGAALLPDPKQTMDLSSDTSKLSFHQDLPGFARRNAEDDKPLLDVLPEPFQYEKRIMYGQFAHADYTEIRHLDGKQQAARLRQLADLFDPTGKILFYYYAYPHIWKDFRPLKIDETVATRAQEKWKVLGSKEQEFWRKQSAKVKKLLGDGNVDGLVCLELDSMDPEVLSIIGSQLVGLKVRTRKMQRDILEADCFSEAVLKEEDLRL